MNTHESLRELPGRQWVAIAVVVGCCLVLAGLFFPAVQNARQAARKMQSKNNLKQLGLAIHNYHDLFDHLPLGADVQANGIAKHGWYTRLIPYLASSPLYSQISLNLPWDHPILPRHRTESTSTPLRREFFEADVEQRSKDTPGTTIMYDHANRPYFADVFGDPGTDEPIWDVGHTTRIDLCGVLENFSEIRVLNVGVVNDQTAAVITQFPDLEFLQAWKFDLSENGEAILKTHPKLKTIVHR